MARTISLYIDGKRADIGEQSFILWNFAQTDATNPTVIKNSYTQQVTLPATPSNCAIFGYLGKGDRIITPNTFNPLKKSPFALYDEMSNLLQEGYVRVDSATPDEYKVTLYGGLGEFFYNLSYNADGTKKTLADLYYQVYNAQDVLEIKKANTIPAPISAGDVYAAWQRLYNDEDQGAQLINFAPCYNGFPTANHFNADKAIYRTSQGTPAVTDMYVDLYLGKSSGGSAYGTKSNCGAILLEMENEHTEWEMQDLRAYLQRPVIRVQRILAAFTLSQNTGEYSLAFGTNFFTTNNHYFLKSWMTLPLVDAENANLTQLKASDLLSGTMTPAEFLIGYAKLCGLVFLYKDKHITVMSRDEYYAGGTSINLEGRYDTSFSAAPHGIESKYLLLKYPSIYGEKAEKYDSKYSKQYGEQKVDTSYDFNSDTEDALKDIPFKSAVQVLEADADFHDYGAQTSLLDPSSTRDAKKFKFNYTEKVTWRLYAGLTELECKYDPTHYGYLANLFEATYSGESGDYSDFIPKVQLHTADNKAEDGSGVLLFFGGFQTIPTYEVDSKAQTLRFHLSNDPAEQNTLLSEGTCWDVSLIGANIVSLVRLPLFGRERSGYIQGGDCSWDFGTPKEYYTQSAPKKPLYQHFWQNYLTDRYDANAVRKTLKVDWNGIQVNAALLRNTYYFENAVWVLESINNYSLTTDDLTECTFVKVMNISNYKSGQTSF